jgi:hypothetical protein
MLLYEVTSSTARVVDGLGVFEADVPQTFDNDDSFQLIRGVRLNQDNVPEGVTVVIKFNEEANG